MTLTEEEFEKDLIPLELIGNVLLFMLVFGMSATVSTKNMKAQLSNKRAIATGVMLQFLVLPFLGFATVKLLDMNKTMGMTLMVVTSSPGGSYSNWWCSILNADLALSVTMTTVSTLLSVAMLPLNLLLYANQAYDEDIVAMLDWEGLFLSLFIVMAAIGLGLACAANIESPTFRSFADKLGNIAGILLVIFSFTVCSSDTESDLAGRPSDFYIGVAAPMLAALIISNVLSTLFGLKKPERVTCSVECCYQNTGIATSIAITTFSGPELAEALGVPLYYGILEAVVLGIYCVVAWKAGWTKAPANENFCTVISTNYQDLEKEGYESVGESEVLIDNKAPGV